MNPVALHRLLGRCLIALSPATATRLMEPGFPWGRFIEAANRAYLTPALTAALQKAGLLPALPAEVAQYLSMIAERNSMRNERLRAQLHELVGAFNRVGIVPILLKGAAGLFGAPDAYAASRMVTDLDLLIGADEVAEAVAALSALGYRRLEGRAVGAHAVGDFIRDIDVGAIDLHLHLVNEPHLLPIEEAAGRAMILSVGGLQARVLSPSDRVLHLLLHDLVQDHGIHDGRLNFRHLHEIAVLAATGAPLHWDAIIAHLDRHRLRSLADVVLLTVHTFFETPIRPAIKPLPGARLLVARSLLQLRYPQLTRCGEIFGNVHRSLAWYRHSTTARRFPRLRRVVDYLRVHHIRTAGRVLHVLFAHRT
jgi:hypothetical protein